uniref:Uncharacterized protein n=1 Tax=Rhizophagus irregularis (strain DAOM 181602 / DAOM 197198 / MUCL 43194) TaxID=747089 RepID=U9SYA9_RHIID
MKVTNQKFLKVMNYFFVSSQNISSRDIQYIVSSQNISSRDIQQRLTVSCNFYNILPENKSKMFWRTQSVQNAKNVTRNAFLIIKKSRIKRTEKVEKKIVSGKRRGIFPLLHNTFHTNEVVLGDYNQEFRIRI